MPPDIPCLSRVQGRGGSPDEGGEEAAATPRLRRTGPAVCTHSPAWEWVCTWSLLPRPHSCMLSPITLAHASSHTPPRTHDSHPSAGPSSSLASPPPPVCFQSAHSCCFIRGLRKLGFSLEFIKAEWSWASASSSPGLGSLPPP